MVKYITYQGEKLPISLSYIAIKGFEEDSGESIEVLDKKISNLEIVLWHALRAGYKAERKEFNVKREDVEWILDECMSEFQKILFSFSPVTSDIPSTEPKKK
jgi:hypothetical protein